ncbi:MAG: M50 family metallopeptidase, partial [Promethearchaeota archaeon]
PNYELILTDSCGENTSIDVNFEPRIATAYSLRNIFVGINFTKVNSTHIQISRVLSNQTEGGVNEGRINEGILITHVNGIALNLTSQSFREFVDSIIKPKVGDILVVTDITGQNYTLNTVAIPVNPIYIGFNSQTYGVPKNWVGQITGPNFPIHYYQFLFYTWMISFSLALFNLLPAGIFDGGRMMKEVIAKIIGEKYHPKTKKKLKYEFNPKQPQQHLYTHNIRKILSCCISPSSDSNQRSKDNSKTKNPSLDQSQKQHDSIESASIKANSELNLDYIALDTAEDGFLDTIEIRSKPLPAPKTIIEVEVEFDLDEREKLKKRVFRIISWITGGVIIASLIISLIKFNNTLFWL